MKHYQACLASNLMRVFSKDDKYSYKRLLEYSFKNNRSIFLTVLFMNLMLIILSLGVDALCIAFNVYYWLSVLFRIPLALLSIFSFQVYKDKGLAVVETILFALAIFIPCYSIYLILYIVLRTYIAEADCYPIIED